jgi:DNA-binding MarR family transcriptional regulator
MDKIEQFREYTRELECHLDNINQADCCQCSVSKAECFLVVEIGRKPGICIKELAGILKIDKSGVSRSVEELVKKGFVTREASKTDRRSVVLELTESGKARFEKIEKDMYVEFKKVFSMIEKKDQDNVLEALRIYNEACRKVEESDDQRDDKE